MIFLNASPVLAVLLNAEGADECETTLTRIETGEIKATTTTHILEEIMFKLVFAKASEVLQSKNVWRIRQKLKTNESLRQDCCEILNKFIKYVKILRFGGLKIIEVYGEDIFNVPEILKQTGLLTSDCLHLSVMSRLNLKKIATLDQDFKKVKGLTVIP
ncbi:MAG: type II toxin-antitoxin system VapC family toxin, partial [Candidatus Heimdallarchaeota archaeon]